MKNIKDRITLGVLSGLLAGTPDTLINALEYKAGITDLTYGQMGANLFLNENKINTREAQLAGYLANFSAISAGGVIFIYILSLTGRDYAILKGVGLGLISWLTVYGLGSKIGLSVKSKKPLAPVLSFFDHVLYGSLLGLITPKLSDETLFRNEQSKE